MVLIVAITRMGYIKDEKNIKGAMVRVIKYITNPIKSESGRLVNVHNIILTDENIELASANQMYETKKSYEKLKGRILYHYKISFSDEDDITPKLAMDIAKEFCEKYLNDYEAVYAVHTNTKHIHFHVVFNSVSFVTGYKYRYEKGDWKKDLQPIVNSICEKYGLSQIDVNKESEKKNKDYGTWANEHQDKKKNYVKEYNYAKIQSDIDACIIKANTYEEFLGHMKERGYKIDDTKKHLRLFTPDRQKAVRSYVLTPDKKTYTKENIKRMILGSKQLDRKKVLEKLYKDWNNYNSTNRVAVILKRKKSNLSFAQYEEAVRLIFFNNLKSKDDVLEYANYLEAADKELNIIKKYVKNCMEYFEVYKDDMDNILSYIRSKSTFGHNENDVSKHEKAVISLRRLLDNGVSPSKLYMLYKRANDINEKIDDYKKKLFVDKRIVQRILKEGTEGSVNEIKERIY